MHSDCNFAWAMLSPHSCRLDCYSFVCGHAAYCLATGTLVTKLALAIEDSSWDSCNHSCLSVELYSEICHQHLQKQGSNSVNTTMAVVYHLVGSRMALFVSQSVSCNLDPTHTSS